MSEPTTSPGAALSAEAVRSIETMYRAFTEKNPDLLDEAVTPDWRDIPLAPGQGPGPGGLKGLIPGFLKAFPDLKITIHEIVGSAGRAGVRAEITGTHEGEWFGVPPTGKAVRIPLHEFHHLKDGRITHTWHLEDWLGWLTQVGAWPAAEGRTMKATSILGHGAAPAVAEVPVPEPGPGQVLVRVAAASVNPLDLKLQGGQMRGFFDLEFPYIAGTDLAGTVERAGRAAGRWRRGDAVVARLDPIVGGALAEFAVVPADQLVAVPAGVRLDDAAGAPTAAGTAWQALFEVAGLGRGQAALIHGGAGGVGGFAIQLAKHAGARVVATASGTGIELARSLGADEVIDYKAEDFAARVSGVDVVLDTIGGDTQRRSFGVLRPGGMLVSTVAPPDEATAKAHGVAATFVFHRSDAGRLAKVVDQIAAGHLRVVVARRVPLADVGDAFEHQASAARGKIIVTMG